MNNVVFFGQADSGKSTLAGYLISRYCSDFQLSRFIGSMKRSQPNYDSRLVFSSIMDTNKDELVKYSKFGTRSLHLRKIHMSFDNVTIIDTPGAEHFRKQRERGMYYGSIGIFFMEINNILEHKYNVETLAPIALWSKLENKRMIFLLTKFDMVNYDEHLYREAYDKVQEICSFFGFNGNVTVIPTAIEVDKIKFIKNDTELDKMDLGENICSHSEKMPWFQGCSVVDAIKAEIEELDIRDEVEPLIFCITDQVDRPDSYNGKVWNIKILSGMLKVGQEICLAPVKDTTGNYCVLTANVRQLRNDLSRFDDKAEVSIARKGEMFGMDIRNCSVEKRHIKKPEYDAISTTCGFSSESQYLMSDKFSVRYNIHDRAGFSEGRDMRLMWFGRSIAFHTIRLEEDEMILHGQLISTQIALPIYDSTFNQSVIIKGEGLTDFYSCKLLSIG